MAANKPIIATTIMISTRVNPAFLTSFAFIPFLRDGVDKQQADYK
jgi:hypothetical protein